MGNMLNMRKMGMEELWHIYGIRLEYIWNVHGIGIRYVCSVSENVWNMYGAGVGYVCNMSTIYWEYVWTLCEYAMCISTGTYSGIIDCKIHNFSVISRKLMYNVNRMSETIVQFQLTTSRSYAVFNKLRSYLEVCNWSCLILLAV